MVLELGVPAGERLEVLCLGAHPDDIEIGCGGTLLRLARERPGLHVHWIVLSGEGDRLAEAHRGAELFLGDVEHDVLVEGFRDGFFPYVGSRVKEFFEELKGRVSPDLIFTHFRGDRHQDHRTVSDLTWNTFRDHLILEYEVPKYDGDLGRPNCYVPLDERTCRDKAEKLMTAFPTQAGRHWFDESTFLGLMRLRGLESRSPGGFAEAFHGHKLRLGL